MDLLRISKESRAELALAVLRIVLALFVAAHGWARLAAGGIAPFGVFLESQGFPFGLLIAWAITLFEIIGSILFLTGRFVFPLSLMFSFIYLMGILLVHAPEGWFVVGLGRNGMEYSVLLIVCFLLVGAQEMPGKWLKRADSEPNG